MRQRKSKHRKRISGGPSKDAEPHKRLGTKTKGNQEELAAVKLGVKWEKGEKGWVSVMN